MDALTILLVEDNPDDRELLHMMLSGIQDFKFTLATAETLAQGRDKLAIESFDLILLDLGLPDSQGLDTLLAMQRATPDTPIMVLSGEADEQRAIKAVQMGAQDYLIKGEAPPEYLARAMRYAVERHRLRSQQQHIHTREYEDWRLSDFGDFPVHGRSAMRSNTPLKEATPERFEQFVATFCILMEKAEDERVYKQESHLSSELRQLADGLAELKAGPRDVVRLYTEALSRCTEGVTQERAELRQAEARLIAFELMGYLVDLYREYALGEPANLP